MFCESLPFDKTCDEPVISIAEDMLDFEMLDEGHSISQFKHATNLPMEVQLQEGARVMFLNNKMFDESICNGTVGVITRLVDDENVKVTFPIFDSIVKIMDQKETSYFEIDGKRDSRKQFPLLANRSQNARFDPASRNRLYRREHICRRTGVCGVEQSELLRVLKFDFSQIKCSSNVLLEYERLERVNRDGLRALL